MRRNEMDSCRQLLVVISDGWNQKTGRALLFERKTGSEQWKAALPVMKCVTGANGLGWGLGLIPDADELCETKKYYKREGDRRSPAGLFRIGDLMGYSPAGSYTGNMKYTMLTDTFQGIDDADSAYYNQIVDISKLPANVKPEWKSYEVMKRKDDLYKWLFIIGHNTACKPGMGSLIFLHIWRSEVSGTAGCTAVSMESMLGIVAKLDAQANPMMLQIPLEEYRKLMVYYRLPAVE